MKPFDVEMIVTVTRIVERGVRLEDRMARAVTAVDELSDARHLVAHTLPASDLDRPVADVVDERSETQALGAAGSG